MNALKLALLLVAANTGLVAHAHPNPWSTQAVNERPLFAIVYRAGPAWKAGVPMEDQGLREHFFYVKALHDRSDILYAGPMGPDGGLILIHAPNQAAADAIIANDPAVKSGIFIGEARTFTPRFSRAGAASP